LLLAAWIVCGHVLGLDDPGSALAQLLSFDVAALDHAQRGHGRDTDDLRGGLERYFSPLGPFALTVDRNFVVIAE